MGRQNIHEKKPILRRAPIYQQSQTQYISGFRLQRQAREVAAGVLALAFSDPDEFISHKETKATLFFRRKCTPTPLLCTSPDSEEYVEFFLWSLMEG